MNTRMVSVVVIALIVALAMPALAQYEASNSSPLGVAVSMFRPSGSQLKAIGENWIGAALMYHLKFDQLDRPSLVFSVGWFSNDGDDASARFVPVRVSAIKRFGSEDQCWYVGAGLDAYFVHYEDGPSYYNVTENDTKFGVNMLFGREIGNGWYFEARSDIVPKLNHRTAGDVDFSGWSLSFGSRFGY